MTAVVRGVNSNADLMLKTELTLSAAGELAQAVDERRSAGLDGILDDHGYPLIGFGNAVPAEAAVRDERDPFVPATERDRLIVTELELRALWGDR